MSIFDNVIQLSFILVISKYIIINNTYVVTLCGNPTKQITWSHAAQSIHQVTQSILPPPAPPRLHTTPYLRSGGVDGPSQNGERLLLLQHLLQAHGAVHDGLETPHALQLYTVPFAVSERGEGGQSYCIASM